MVAYEMKEFVTEFIQRVTILGWNWIALNILINKKFTKYDLINLT